MSFLDTTINALLENAYQAYKQSGGDIHTQQHSDEQVVKVNLDDKDNSND